MRPTLPRAAFGVGLAASLFLGAAPASAQQTFDVDTTNDSVDAAPGDGLCADADGNCSLRAAVQEANASGAAALVRLAKGATYTLTLAGADEDAAVTGDLDVTTQIEVRGSDATVDAAMLDRVFDVAAGASLTLDRVTLLNGAVMDASGGAVRSAGALHVDRSVIRDSAATGMGASGGGLFNDGGLLTLARSEISGCDAERAGGAVEANGGVTRVDRSDLLGNTTGPTPGNGGALHLTGAGIVDVQRSEISGNTASAEGGGLWNSSTGTMTVDRCDVLDNVAQGDAADQGGGGLFNDGGMLSLLRSTVRGNSATGAAGSGGGVLNDGGAFHAFRADIAENVSNRAGGGVEADGGSTVLNRSKLLDNATGASPGNGGGLHLTGAGTVLVTNSTVSGNTASAEGGGLWNSADGTLSVVGSKIDDNVASGASADQGGGGLFNDGGVLEVERTQSRGNVADGAAGSGGGLLNNLGAVFLSKSGFVNNTSVRAGGGVEANVGFSLLVDVVLKGNSTGASPGNGGGLHLTGAGIVALLGGNVSGNDASAEGGGLWNSSTGVMSADGTKVKGNSAPLGPDLFNDGGSFVVDAADVPPTDP